MLYICVNSKIHLFNLGHAKTTAFYTIRWKNVIFKNTLIQFKCFAS